MIGLRMIGLRVQLPHRGIEEELGVGLQGYCAIVRSGQPDRVRLSPPIRMRLTELRSSPNPKAYSIPDRKPYSIKLVFSVSSVSLTSRTRVRARVRARVSYSTSHRTPQTIPHPQNYSGSPGVRG